MALAALGLFAWVSVAAAQEAPPPPVVMVQTVETRDVPNISEFIGRIQAVERVDIVARVAGTLLEPRFTEGDRVEAGQLLYQIDPAPFQADVNGKAAQLASAEAAAANAELNNSRAQDLAASQAGSRATADTRAAELAQANAAVQIAEAALEMARITLGYTEITTPIAGRIGRSAITEGNIVSPATGPLARVVQDEKVWAVFAPSQREVLAYRKAGFETPPVVRLELADGSAYESTGSIDFLDNTVDPTTDSQTLRATFDNPDKLLIDGQTIRVLVEQPADAPVMVVAQVALAADQSGTFVRVVDAENKVVTKYVTIGQQRDGMAVVSEGLAEGDRVIVQGAQRVRNGMVVDPQPAASGS
jgi:membrane fusion protein (multidrug efflux system)